MKMRCIFCGTEVDETHCHNDDKYLARDAKEAKYGQEQMFIGFTKGYHMGLKEGFIKARYPEICHCSICHSHGQMCKNLNL